MNLIMDFADGKTILGNYDKYVGPAITEEGIGNKNKFSIQDENYKIIYTNNSKKYYMLRNSKEKKIENPENNDRLFYLENKLNNHIKTQKDKNKLDEVISKKLRSTRF
jgi:hypothetical protein